MSGQNLSLYCTVPDGHSITVLYSESEAFDQCGGKVRFLVRERWSVMDGSDCVCARACMRMYFRVWDSSGLLLFPSPSNFLWHFCFPLEKIIWNDAKRAFF